MFLFLAFLIFTGALGATAYYVWSVPQQEAQQLLANRLRELRLAGGGRSRTAGDLVRSEHAGRFAPLAGIAGFIGVHRRLQLSIDQANLRYRGSDVLLLSVAIAAAFYLLLGLFGLDLFILRVGISLALGSVPVVYILQVRKRRLHKFELALPDAIDLFIRSMRAGHTIHAGIETIAQETFDPVRMEFRKVVEELALGAPIEQALHGLGRRVPLVDLKFFVTGLILQRQTGANMVEVLENLSVLVRERLNLSARIKAATAQQRFSAGLLCGLPVVVGLGMWIAKPEYIRLLYTDELGQKFFTYAVISEIVGILVIRKIANPRF